MLKSLGSAVYRSRRLVLALTAAFLVFASVWGTGVFGQMSGDASLDDPQSESQRIGDRINAELGPQGVDFVGLYSSSSSMADQKPFRSVVKGVVTRLDQLAAVEAVDSYYSTRSPGMISEDGSETILTVRLVDDADDDDVADVKDALEDTAGSTVVTAQVGGSQAVDMSIEEQVPSDIARAEMIAMPLLLIALLFVFGSVVAASMPVMIGGLAVLGAFTVVRAITYATDVSIFSLNIITILGLGLAVDYGLFMVGRFREELARGAEVREAVEHTMETAGHMVLVSGLLVTLALSSLTLFPQTLLRSMGFGGAAAVACAMLVSLTVLPAMLSVLGHRINAGRVPVIAARREARIAAPSPLWSRFARRVMNRPVVSLLGCLVLLALLALPATQIRFGGVDERMLPSDNTSRLVAEQVASEFPGGGLRPVRVLLSDATSAGADAFETELAAVPGVTGVQVAAQDGPASLFYLEYDGEASSSAAQGVVTDVRSLSPPTGASVMVGGTSAEVIDQKASLAQRLPWMLLLVAGITFLVLAAGFRSVVVPLKAITMNAISIAAAFGVVTWIFQDGHLSGWLDFTSTGYIEASQPILMVAILFGLSMDYEVFLLSRIKESWDQGHDSATSVAHGLERTGSTITTAALLMCIVVGFFSTSGIVFIKMIGVGMVIAILLDATIVRLVLVPATMRLLGARNWWAPSLLRRTPEPVSNPVPNPVSSPVPEPVREPSHRAKSLDSVG